MIAHFPFSQKYANAWCLSSGKYACVPPQPDSVIFQWKCFEGAAPLRAGQLSSPQTAVPPSPSLIVALWFQRLLMQAGHLCGCESDVHPCITPHMYNIEWRGSHRWFHSGETAALTGPLVVMNLLFILYLTQQHLPHPITSLIHLPRKQTGHSVLMWTTWIRGRGKAEWHDGVLLWYWFNDHQARLEEGKQGNAG